MIKNKIKNFCPAPFRQICINALGEVSACCIINREGFGKLQENLNNTLDNVYDGDKWQDFYNGHLNEQMPSICDDLCGRNYPNEYHHQWKRAKDQWVEKTHDIKLADIAFSNICNLSCTMCNSFFSSEWIKIKSDSQHKIWNFSKKQCIELANKLQNAENITIKGGEPFLNERFTFFLEEMLNYNNNDKTHINVLTNGTIINDRALKLLSQFKDPKILYSLESTKNDLYSFIRGCQHDFDHLKQTIEYVSKKYPNIIRWSNYIVGSLNAANYLEDMKNLRSAGIQEVNLMIIHGPIEQSVHVLKKSVIKKLIKDIEKDVLLNPKFYKMMKEMTLADTIKQLVDVSNKSSPQFSESKVRDRFDVLCNIRKSQNLNVNSITDIVPDFYSRCEFNEYT